MNIKYKYIVIPLIIALLFGGRNNEYSNELKEYKRLPLSNSNYNFDKYNDFIAITNRYYNAYLEYINFHYFTKLELKDNSTYTYQDCSLFYFKDHLTFYKNNYSLYINSNNDYKSFELNTSKSFYLYFSYEYLDLRCDNIIYFVKDKYRICIENSSIKSILSYEDLLYYESSLYKIENAEIKSFQDIKKEQELIVIANIYLTEYF